MPRTKREGIFYGAVMAFTMSLFMNLFNTFLHAGASMESLGRALLLQPSSSQLSCWLRVWWCQTWRTKP